MPDKPYHQSTYRNNNSFLKAYYPEFIPLGNICLDDVKNENEIPFNINDHIKRSINNNRNYIDNDENIENINDVNNENNLNNENRNNKITEYTKNKPIQYIIYKNNDEINDVIDNQINDENITIIHTNNVPINTPTNNFNEEEYDSYYSKSEEYYDDEENEEEDDSEYKYDDNIDTPKIIMLNKGKPNKHKKSNSKQYSNSNSSSYSDEKTSSPVIHNIPKPIYHNCDSLIVYIYLIFRKVYHIYLMILKKNIIRD